MSKNIRVKPGKTQSAMGFAVGIVFCLIGLFLVIPQFGAFGIFWTAIAVVITATNGINAFGKKGITSSEIIIDDDNDYTDSSSQEIRLTKLKNMYDKGLITAEEYAEMKFDRRNNLWVGVLNISRNLTGLCTTGRQK